MFHVQPSKEDEGDSYTLKFLPTVAQEIIDEFALRYAVEPIFRMMVYVTVNVHRVYLNHDKI